MGGDFTYDVLKSHIKFGGRIVACGSVSSYNKSEDERTGEILMPITGEQKFSGTDEINGDSR